MRKQQLPDKNEFGDNGWWKIAPLECAHYYQKQRAICGVVVTSGNRNHLLASETHNKKCKHCDMVRRNHLRARYNQSRTTLADQAAHIIQSKSHSPRKPQ